MCGCCAGLEAVALCLFSLLLLLVWRWGRERLRLALGVGCRGSGLRDGVSVEAWGAGGLG